MNPLHRLALPASCAALLAARAAGAEPIADDPPEHGAPFFVGEPAPARPLPPKEMVPHPLLAEQSSIHVDLYNSDVTDLKTPLGVDPKVTSRRFGDIGTCLNFVFDRLGRLFAFCGVPREGELSFELTALDPETLEKLSTYPLLSLTLAELVGLPLDLGYMVFDRDSRFIAIDRDNRVLWVGPDGDAPDSELVAHETRDFSRYVPVERDKIASVVPDYEGRLLYHTLGKHDADGRILTPALLGIVDDDANSSDQVELTGEFVENGLAVAPDGVFVLTDRAMYGFRYDAATHRLQQTFRQPYEHGTGQIGGEISFGSGSTPTLLGDRWVAITDHADDRVHLLVIDRTPDAGAHRVTCDVPLFDSGASANENSVVGVGRSLVVQNWYGAPSSILSSDHRSIVPGLVRVDVRENASGCDVVWYTRELASPATLKLSTATGLLYAAMLDQKRTDVDAYYMNAIDFETGRTVYRVRLGVGPEANIQFSPTYVGPTGAVYQPVRAGVVALEDGPPKTAAAARGGCSVARSRGDSNAWLAALTSIAAAFRLRKRRNGRRGGRAGGRVTLQRCSGT